MESLPDIRITPPGPCSQALAERLKQAECAEVTCLEDDFPVFWSKAQGCIVTDVDENRYLDLTAAFGVASIGHAHPKIQHAICQQSQTLIHGMGDVHPSPQKLLLAERLAEFAPGDLGRPIFALSGSEAVEAARKSCVIATGRPGLLTFSGAYHGLSYGTLELTAREEFKAPFRAQLAATSTEIPYPFCYRCPYGQQAGDCQLECISAVRETLETLPSTAAPIGGILLEPIQGRGGTVIPPPEFLPALRQICDEKGLLLLFDEVYTGFGRTGARFEAERVGVLPDLLAVGKALGGGLPISACLGTRAVMERWPRSTGEALHTSTFLGHPLSCAAALATLDVLQEEHLIERARDAGAAFLRQLQTALGHLPVVGDIRGVGMMIGIELVEDRRQKTPAPQRAVAVMKAALRRGLILLPEGVHGNVLGLTPPLTLHETQMDYAVEVLKAELGG